MATTRTLGKNGSRQVSHLKERSSMTPSNLGTPITRTVFDLKTFDDVKLTKPFPLPEKPTSVSAALALVGNDETALLDLIYKGVVSKARDAAYESLQGFLTVEDNEPYTGQCADEETGKKIDNAILALAKVNGYSKDLPKEKKDAIKAEVASFLRANPGMLKGIMGSAPTPASE